MMANLWVSRMGLLQAKAKTFLHINDEVIDNLLKVSSAMTVVI
jgi:hypothetical protein